MNSRVLPIIATFLTIASIFLSCKDKDIEMNVANISALNCATTTFSAAATSGSSFTGEASVPYTGGNGVAYDEGTPVASSGITGLTATLSAGTLSNGSGTATYVITGTPATAGTASFTISLGGQSCDLSLPVVVSKASISSLTSTTTPANGINGVNYSGNATLAYTGGNGGTYEASTATSTGVEGLTATLTAGTLASGTGNLVYIISGTPTSVGTATFNLSLGGQTYTLTVVVTASSTASAAKDTVVIAYSGTTASISNAFQDAGVTVAVSGADVTVTSKNTTREIVYLLSGTATKGSFKIYSEYKYNITLKGLSLTNSSGPAINSQSGKKGTIHVMNGTTNTLVDGVTYATSTEDQKGTFFSEGQLSFMGTGTLNVTGNNKHALVADDYIYVSEATVNIKSAAKDGIHANDYFMMDSGTVTITALGDGVEAEEGYVAINGGTFSVNSVGDGIKTSYEGTDATITPYILIKGGKINITTTGEKGNAIKSEGYTTIGTADAVTLAVSGKGSKGIKTGGDFTLTAGTIKISVSGAAYYVTADADIAAPAGINCDKNLAIKGGSLTITSTGTGGKGITVDGTATVSGGSTLITVSGTNYTYSSALTSDAKGFKSDGAFIMNNGDLTISATDDGLKSDASITVNDGNITVTKSYEAMESIFITINGGITNLTATNDGINTSYGTVSGGTESNDNSSLTVNGGVLIATGSDAIDSNGNFTIKGGIVIANGNEDIDVNGNFLVNGGTLIGAEPSNNMTKAMGAASAQVGLFIKSSAQVATTSVIHIEDASGKELVTFKPKSSSAYFHFSAPGLAKSAAYKIYFGGSYSGGSFLGNTAGWGLHTGGTYSNSGATLKATPTTSATSTVNTISF
ncbi:carbohydrate-binding domain-containing protein [Dyadobacter psychrotolerans]|uniref:Carbohydrate-binding domain-containing protein n=1 Tax=Dyadobacter psychrotolerans TaxID=2541721 RepID=A0A4R5D5Y4_9BACT|nr:carbohydrate-binding domain-containing protein [Dyadobacter psychrotolerans]TDE07967.1 carbohydrate-binding domain-containing protein [Dyadobacter psychrotolerans]